MSQFGQARTQTFTAYLYQSNIFSLCNMRFVYRVAFVKKRIHINYMFYIQF